MRKQTFFAKFDIVDFYPSISKDLVTNTINFATTITSIGQKTIDTIMHSRKSLLFSNNEIWVKKEIPVLTLLWEASTEQRYAS